MLSFDAALLDANIGRRFEDDARVPLFRANIAPNFSETGFVSDRDTLMLTGKSDHSHNKHDGRDDYPSAYNQNNCELIFDSNNDLVFHFTPQDSRQQRHR